MRNDSIAVVVLCGTLAVPAIAETTVSFVEPDKFVDAGPYGNDRKQTMGEIEGHLKALGQRHLPPGQDLRIEVLDIDLAGRIRHDGRDPMGMRVINGRTDAPMIRLRYALEADGKVVETREERITDPTYFDAPRPPSTTGALFYEKRMLDDWFRSRFVKATR